MNITELVTTIRREVEETNYKCFSPDFPQNEQMCVSLTIGQGDNIRSLNKNILYSEIPFYLLIRGNLSDTETRTIADKIFNQLDHLTKSSENIRIINISCETPNYAFRDENQRIYYNINCTCKVQWEREV